MKPISAVIGGQREEYTLNRSPVHHIIAHKALTDTLKPGGIESPPRLMRMSLDCRRKGKYLDKTYADAGRTCKLYTKRPCVLYSIYNKVSINLRLSIDSYGWLTTISRWSWLPASSRSSCLGQWRCSLLGGGGLARARWVVMPAFQ